MLLNHEKTIRRALETGKDPHTVWAAILFNKPENEVNMEERTLAKSQNYFLLYNARFLATVNFPKENQVTEKTYTPAPLTGYRALTQTEVDMINAIKQMGVELENLTEAVKAHVASQREASHKLPETGRGEECARLDKAQPERWIAVSRTHFQEGLMALTRAIAQPTTF